MPSFLPHQLLRQHITGPGCQRLGLNLGLFMLGLSVASVLGLSLLVTPCYSYEPTFDKEEEENISVYDKAAKAVVTINCLVDGQPSSGSGVLLDASGLIVTSSHVIGSATVVYVALEDGRKARGTVIGRAGNRTTNAQMGQVSSDLALIKIRLDGDIPYLRLADSSKIRVGQRLLAIGHPYGFERTLTTGIVSRLDVKRDRIQTDAAINPGNSGGPVLDTKGYVLGINQAIYNPENSRSNIGIGFAVPANTVKAFMRDLAHMEGVPPTVASISQKPLIRYRPESDETGYEKVSLILERLANQP